MSATLLIRLRGPLQSWGTQSRFTIRETQLEPTKSGVIGLVCAALGRDRSEPIGDLAELRMGVRVLSEGILEDDFHVAGMGGFIRASGAIEKSDVIPSHRYYLSDADFLVGLEGKDRFLLKEIHSALGNPHWPLSLGRKSFLPSLPVSTEEGVVDTALVDALTGYGKETSAGNVGDRYVIEHRHTDAFPDDYPGEATLRFAGPDQPISFAERKFAPREVVTYYTQSEKREATNEK